MKILADRYIPFLKGRLEAYSDIRYIDPSDFTAQTVRDADALLIRTRTRCDRSLLEGSRVGLIATATIGMDQFDRDWCSSAGIATVNSPGCNAPAVAQYVWSSLLHMGISESRHFTIGVAGHGHVGSIVADWGEKMGFNVLLCDPYKHGPEYMPLHEMLPLCDAVTLHTPLTRTGEYPTYHMIGEREVSLMRPGAWLVNAARGPVVDSAAVGRGAESGKIRLITDCWEGEPDNLDPRILRCSAIATPHIAGYSLQGKARATRMVLEAVARHFSLPTTYRRGEEGIPLWDLPTDYTPWPSVIPSDVTASYDPLAETARLKADPTDFENWRDHYRYRSELYLD